MIAAQNPRRSGITLTEILIAILIMAVGLISLATLFPLGLLRLQEATRQSRAGLTVRTAADDVDARALLFKPSFLNTWYGARDPFTQDCYADASYYSSLDGNNNPIGSGVIASGSLTIPQNNITWGNAGSGINKPDGYSVGPLTSGLPFCYDPLWRAITGVAPNIVTKADAYNGVQSTTLLHDAYLDCLASYITTTDEARFGSAMFGSTAAPYIHDGTDKNADPDKSAISAHGLQRLSNFIPFSQNNLTPNYAFTYVNQATDGKGNLLFSPQAADVAGNVFTSVDDIIFNSAENGTASVSSLVPDMTDKSGQPMADYRYTWFFTGRQADANGNGAQFTGEIVVCDSRPFSFDPLPGSTTLYAPAGETVVEAIYGYNGNTRAVLLRWRDTLADPRVRVGGWIADTTYERTVSLYRSRAADTATPFVRCNWYQVARRTDPAPDLAYPTTHRSMVVTLTSPVRVSTPSTSTLGVAVHQNVALIMPSVVNVFPRSFEVH